MSLSYNEIIIKYVAEYLRKSRGESNEDLIKHKTVLEELCKRKGWIYVPYEAEIIAEISSCEDTSTDVIQDQIKTIMDKINKKDGALKRARIAYDEGVDTLDEYRYAKERITKEIEDLENQLNIENLKLQKSKSISNHEKLHYINEYRAKRKNKNLTDKELNDLYKTIISSIIWTRQGDDIDIKVNFL